MFTTLFNFVTMRHTRHITTLLLTTAVLSGLHGGVQADSEVFQGQPYVPSQTAEGDNEYPAEKTPKIATGESTKIWLGSQAKRQQASKTRQTLSGPVMQAVHDRYVNSFTVAVPPTTALRPDTPSTGR